MKQHSENQYDDDLTVGTDTYDDAYYTNAVDLFEFSTDDDSPINRLKSLVLSIDWEITDEILEQFNEELLDLKDIWAGQKINLVYVQALQKVSKYIYQKKASAHPNAIKLLLGLYHNLEKIITDEELAEDEKKAILSEDVKRFESFKSIISRAAATPAQETAVDTGANAEIAEKPEVLEEEAHDLVNLKAIVLGIDWEITDQDLNDLREEVVKLEERFAGSRPKLILLQGIGVLGAYIKVKKINAHADAFKILHFFYDSLEKIATTSMSLEEEKAVLFPAVEKFNEFKALVGPTIAVDGVDQAAEEAEDEEDIFGEGSSISPALADVDEEVEKGFQPDEEATALGLETPENITAHIDDFFGADVDTVARWTDSGLQNPEPETFAAPLSTAAEIDDGSQLASREIALQGVEVERDDDEYEPEPELTKGPVAELSEPVEPQPAEMADLAVTGEVSSEVDEKIPANETGELSALPGVAVESDADDESGEEALPMMGDELAPALADNDEVSLYSAESMASGGSLYEAAPELSEKLDGFFGEEESEPYKEEEHAGVAEDKQEAEFAENIAGLSSEISAEGKLDDQLTADDIDEAVVPFGGEAETALTASAMEEEIDHLLQIVEEETDTQTAQSDTFFTENEIAETLPLDEEASAVDAGKEEQFPAAGEEDTISSADIAAEVAPVELLSAEQADLEPAVAESVAAPPPEKVVETMEEVVFELVEEEIGEGDQQKTEETVPAKAAYEADVEEFLDFYMAPDQDLSGDSSPPLAELASSIDSLATEVNNTATAALLLEINQLRQKWYDKPLRRIFLQLLSTVGQHIDTYRSASSSEALPILRSIYGALTQLTDEDSPTNHQLLLVQTLRVLEWQQEMLAERAVEKGDEPPAPADAQDNTDG